MTTPSRKRSAEEVINQAINDNRFGEQLLYLIACTTFVVGIFALGIGAWRGEPVIAISGCVSSAFFYPAIRLAKSIRAQNIAIRLLEIPLNNSKTAEEAATILSNFFESTFTKNQKGLQKS